MAVVLVKSAGITNQDATPRSANTGGYGAGTKVVEVEDSVAVASDDSANSIYRVVRLPSNAVIKNIILKWTDIGNAAAGDVGLHYPAAGPDLGVGQTASAAVDVDLFGTAVVFTDALSTVAGSGIGQDVTHEGTAFVLADRAKPLWEAAGLSADPGGKFDLTVKLTTGSNTAGAILGIARYIAS